MRLVTVIWLDQAGRDRLRCCLGAVRRAQLDSGIVDMEIDGPLYDLEFARNLLRRPAVRHQGKDFDFPLIQNRQFRQPYRAHGGGADIDRFVRLLHQDDPRPARYATRDPRHHRKNKGMASTVN